MPDNLDAFGAMMDVLATEHFVSVANELYSCIKDEERSNDEDEMFCTSAAIVLMNTLREHPDDFVDMVSMVYFCGIMMERKRQQIRDGQKLIDLMKDDKKEQNGECT